MPPYQIAGARKKVTENTSIEILGKNRKFRLKIKIWVKIEIFGEKSNFWVKIEIFGDRSKFW